jgi:hypothetical protein
MTETTPAHPLVARYLSQFDADASVLPVHRARELREQLASHIDEAAAADASDEDIAAVLRGLGSPRLLVAEAAAAAGRRPWAARAGWKVRALIGALVLAAAAVSGYYIRIHSIDPLFVEGSSAWWYPQDYTRQVTTYADGATQATVPIRPGQRQGFIIEVFNLTGMTQTVLGSNLRGFGPNGGTSVRVTLSTSDPDHAGNDPHALSYALPVSIPPGQSRYLRITWISHGCLTKQNTAGINSVELRVRVGWTIRTEHIQFNEGFYLGHGRYCPT